MLTILDRLIHAPAIQCHKHLYRDTKFYGDTKWKGLQFKIQMASIVAALSFTCYKMPLVESMLSLTSQSCGNFLLVTVCLAMQEPFKDHPWSNGLDNEAPAKAG